MPGWPSWRVSDGAEADTAPTVSEMSYTVDRLALARVGQALDRLGIASLSVEGISLVAMWERHAVLFTVEGPADEILVLRARPHATVPGDWVGRAYLVLNEWNHTRRFGTAYLGDPGPHGERPIYAEMQVPLATGVHEALLVELLDSGVTMSHAFVDWLHDDGALL